jgi:hypothetical protein
MKITLDTPDQLVIDDTPWIFGLILIGAMLVTVGIGLSLISNGEVAGGLGTGIGATAFIGLFFAIFVRRNQLVADRSRDLLELRRRTVFGKNVRRYDLHDLREAVVQTSRDDNSETHRMALIISGGMDAGTHPFTAVYSSGRGARRAADTVNRWLGAAPEAGH